MGEQAGAAPPGTHLGLVVTGVVLSLAFLFLLLVIVNAPLKEPQVQSVMPDYTSQSAETAVGTPDRTLVVPASAAGIRDVVRWMLKLLVSRPSAFILETLIAGMLGAYVGEVSRLVSDKSGNLVPENPLYFKVALLFGGAAAISIGVLLPLVILNRFEGADINSWTLVAAGGIAGNRVRAMMNNLETVVKRLLGDLEERDVARIADSVKVGVREAFAGPKVVNYEGVLAVGVTGQDETSVVSQLETGSWVAQLMPETSYALGVRFASDKLVSGPSGLVTKALVIRGGVDQAEPVSFRVLVDFGFPDIPPEERMVSAPRQGESKTESFSFRVPERTPSQDASESSADQLLLPEISVSVYQNARFFESLSLDVHVEGAAARRAFSL